MRRRLLQHITVSRTPFVLRRACTQWSCATRWWSQPARSPLLAALHSLPYLFAHRSPSSLFGHFTEERLRVSFRDVLELGLLPGTTHCAGPQLDGFWYYLSTPLPRSLHPHIPLHRIGLNIPFDSLRVNLWSGVGAHTATHRDGAHMHNLFLQVRGEKAFALVAPNNSPEMEPMDRFGMPNASDLSLFEELAKRDKGVSASGNVVTSKLNRNREIPANFAEFDLQSYSDFPIHSSLLHTGDILYVPPGWWHEFKAPKDNPTHSVSLSCWFR